MKPIKGYRHACGATFRTLGEWQRHVYGPNPTYGSRPVCDRCVPAEGTETQEVAPGAEGQQKRLTTPYRRRRGKGLKAAQERSLVRAARNRRYRQKVGQ